MKKSIVFLHSYHNMNTQKIGMAIADKINASVINVIDIKVPMKLDSYDLIGFGAGIDSGKHYPDMLRFVEKLQNVQNKNAFIFSTNGIYTEKKWLKIIRHYGFYCKIKVL